MKVHTIFFKTMRVISLLLALCLLIEMTSAQTPKPAKKRVVKKPTPAATTLTPQPKPKKFISADNMEVGGSFTFLNTTPVNNGVTGTAESYFSILPSFGYFVMDGLELAVSPLGAQIATVGGTTSSELSMYFAPAYYFDVEDIWYPYIQGLVGYTSESKIVSIRPATAGVSYGGQVGAKISITGNGLLNIGVQYLMVNLKTSSASTRSGRNDLAASIGFSLWF